MATDLKTILDLLQNQMTTLQTQQEEINQQYRIITNQQASLFPFVEEYQETTVITHNANEISLELFKTLPEFNGNRLNYPTWRTMVITPMSLLEKYEGSMRYYEALTIIRNKIIGPASNMLNN